MSSNRTVTHAKAETSDACSFQGGALEPIKANLLCQLNLALIGTEN